MSGSSGVVVFDYAAWAAQYPELSGSVASAQASGYFDQACLYLDNTACSPVPTAKRATILNMLVSHIAALLATIAGSAPSGLVGRINTATEGSVSVAAELKTPDSAAWWAQTRYGLLAWQALAPYRAGLYIAGPQVPRGAQSYPGWFV
jgi:hypothetical protein